MIAYLELADYLLIAERVLGLPAETIANFNQQRAAFRSQTAALHELYAAEAVDVDALRLLWKPAVSTPKGRDRGGNDPISEAVRARTRVKDDAAGKERAISVSERYQVSRAVDRR